MQFLPSLGRALKKRRGTSSIERNLPRSIRVCLVVTPRLAALSALLAVAACTASPASHGSSSAAPRFATRGSAAGSAVLTIGGVPCGVPADHPPNGAVTITQDNGSVRVFQTHAPSYKLRVRLSPGTYVIARPGERAQTVRLQAGQQRDVIVGTPCV